MLKLGLFLSICMNFILLIDGKFVTKIEHEGEGVKAYAYKGNGENIIACSLYYVPTYRKIGWDLLQVQTNPDGLTDIEQANCAGFLEGLVTVNATYIHYYNNIKQWCKGRKQMCSKVFKFLDDHLEWIEQSIKDNAGHDPIWHHVQIYYSHLVGMQQGYAVGNTYPKRDLTMTDFMMMNLQDDLDDVAAALEGDTSAKVRGDTRCSAIVKLLPDNEDLLVGHNTWTSYVQMYRMLKFYDMPVHINNHSEEIVPGRQISFSGYPGIITSGDDFYVLSSGLVALETTIGNNNASLWQNVNSTGQLFEAVRSLIAMRLAKNGKTWCQTFSAYNSGTYNNQWMIVDHKQFKKGKKPRKGTLWILEQIPGYIRAEDQTDMLTRQTYWPSYNVPFYPDIFDMSGNQQLVDEYGDWFSYNNTSRALIFKRNHSSVTDLDSLMGLMRYNDYKHDEYAKCNCTPPYSAENAIAARSDLNPKNGHYPFPALGHRPHGAIDAKVVSHSLAHNMSFVAVCGPTTGTKLPPFRWNKSDFKHLPHKGQPNTFTNFSPVLSYYYGPFF